MLKPFLAKTKPFLLPVLIGSLVLAVALPLLMPKQDELVRSGLVQAKEIRNGSQFGGRVKQVFVTEGQIVKQGQPLVELDNTELLSKFLEAKAGFTQAQSRKNILKSGADRNDLQQALSLVKKAEQQLQLLQHGATRQDLAQAQAEARGVAAQFEASNAALTSAEQLLKAGVISPKKYESLESQQLAAKSQMEASRARLTALKNGSRPEEIKMAQSELMAARANYEKLRQGVKPDEVAIASASVEQANVVVDTLEKQLKETIVKAPTSGMVSVLNASTGELIQPGRPIVSIVDHEHLWTDINVPETKLYLVNVGQKISVAAPAYPKTLFEGSVVFINPKSEFIPSGSEGAKSEEESSFRVKISLNPLPVTGTKRLYPGMKVQVRFRQAS